MTVAIPLLWGIPPRHETLRYASFWVVSCELTAAYSHGLSLLADAVLLSSLAEVLWRRCTDNGSCMNRLYQNVYLNVCQHTLYSSQQIFSMWESQPAAHMNKAERGTSLVPNQYTYWEPHIQQADDEHRLSFCSNTVSWVLLARFCSFIVFPCKQRFACYRRP